MPWLCRSRSEMSASRRFSATAYLPHRQHRCLMDGLRIRPPIGVESFGVRREVRARTAWGTTAASANSGQSARRRGEHPERMGEAWCGAPVLGVRGRNLGPVDCVVCADLHAATGAPVVRPVRGEERPVPPGSWTIRRVDRAASGARLVLQLLGRGVNPRSSVAKLAAAHAEVHRAGRVGVFLPFYGHGACRRVDQSLSSRGRLSRARDRCGNGSVLPPLVFVHQHGA